MQLSMAEKVTDEFEHSAGCFRWSANTIIGKVRNVNEDRFLATPGLWVVADGMGGHAAGRTASEIVIGAFADLDADGPLELSDVPSVLEVANRKIRERAATDGHEIMGTTVCGVALVDNGGEDALLVFNVGDSRCYEAVPAGGMSQITIDHSHVQELVDRGQISPEEARTHPQRNIVSRAIGIEDSVAADFFVLPRTPINRLLVCSDGVSGEVDDEAIARILAEAETPDDATDALLGKVAEGAARDNATVVVLDAAWTIDESIGDDEPFDGETTVPRPAGNGAEAVGDLSRFDGSASVIRQVPEFAATDDGTEGHEGAADGHRRAASAPGDDTK